MVKNRYKKEIDSISRAISSNSARKIFLVFVKKLRKKYLVQVFVSVILCIALITMFVGDTSIFAESATNTWNFNSSSGYTYDAGIEFSGGAAQLSLESQTFVDNTEGEFNGTHSNTEWSTDHIQLSSGQTSGNYTSSTKDGGTFNGWTQLGWNSGATTSWCSTAGTCDSDWTRRQLVKIDNSSGDAQTNYQVKVEVSYDGDMQADFDDLRFTDSNGTTVLDHWTDPDLTVASTSTVVWVEVPSISAASTQNMWMYFGNASASSTSNAQNTFIVGDDFDDNSLDTTTRWSALSGNGSITESSQKLNLVYTGSETNDWWDVARYETVLRTKSPLSGSWEAVVRVDSYTVNDFSQTGLAVYQSDGTAYLWGRYNNGFDNFLMEEIGQGNLASYSSTTLPAYVKIRNVSGTCTFWVSFDKSTWSQAGSDFTQVSPDYVVLFGKEWGVDNDLSFQMDNFYIRKYTATEPATHTLRLQARTGASSPPTGSFVGPNGSTSKYFTNPDGESYSSSSRYLQYKAYFNTSDSSYSPDLSDVTGTYQRYYTSSPTVRPTSALSVSNLYSWDSFTETATKNGGSINYQLSDDGGSTWKYWSGSTWASAGASDYNSASVVNTNIGSFPTSAKQIMFKAFLTGDGSQLVQLDNIDIGYSTDTDAPTNPTTINGYSNSGQGTSLTSSSWYNYTTPYFSWSGATDPGSTPSGVDGYYVYFGTDETAIPSTSGNYQTAANYTASLSGTTSGSSYYLRIQTKDDGGNVYTNANTAVYTVFTYKIDTVAPETSSQTLVASPAGYVNTTSYTFLWTAATDASSGMAGYKYKTGATGATDSSLITATSISTAEDSSLVPYQEGANKFYLKARDSAGNESSYIYVNYHYAGVAPSEPQNLAATPSSSDENSFAFSWSEPASYTGAIEGYYYSINAEPTEDNATWTTDTSLDAFAAASQQGENTFYVVAKDDGGNINWDLYASVNFDCSTRAPKAPRNVLLTDSSDRSAKKYSFTITWMQPENLDEDTFDYYKVERSTNGDDFSQISTTTSIAYIDTGLSKNKKYYYRVKAVDNAGSESGASSVVSGTPEGRYTTAPELTQAPQVTAGPYTAVVKWETSERLTNSFVQYGKASYSEKEVGISEYVNKHEVTLSGLEPETVYKYRIKSVDIDDNVVYSSESVFKTSEAPRISNVQISDIGLDSAIATWDTNIITTTKMSFGKTSDLGTAIEDTSKSTVTKHTIRLENLSHSTKYYYKTSGTDVEGNYVEGEVHIFETLPYPVVSNVRFQNQTQGRTEVLWKTNTPTTSSVIYRKSDEKEVERVNSELTTDHNILLLGLEDDTEYKARIEGLDQFGNKAASDDHKFTTMTDTVPPLIYDVKTDSQTVGSGEDGRSQIFVSWKTDEISTSQVEFGEGLSGSYTQKTAEDAALVNDHGVVITDVRSAQGYHVRVISKDKSGNITESDNYVVLTTRKRASIIQEMFSNLESIFFWITKVGDMF
ncbi:MAG: PKD protein [uncultured bacterium]|nr:MAG: PKD protein [uncultured bacterium]